MISLYIPGIYNYLILSRPLRSVERGLFVPKDHTKSLIRIHDRDAINSMSNLIEPEKLTQNLCLKLDMTEILKGHLGVQVVWQPVDIPEPEDANKMFKDLVEAGLCFVPVVGPPASTCFSLFMEIVNNPEAFEEKDPLDLGGTIVGDIASSAEAVADGLPKYSKAGKLFGFLGKLGGAVTKLAKE